VRLVGPICNWRAHARILRIGICYRSEQEHSVPGATTAGHEDHKENVLGCDWKLRYSAALQSARCNPDHCQPDDYLRASSGEITKDSGNFGGNDVLPAPAVRT